MTQYQMLWSEKVVTHIIKQLEKRRLEGSYAANSAQARDEVQTMIPLGAIVYRCNSLATTVLGLWEKLAVLPGVIVLYPYLPGIPPEERIKMRRRGLTADVMITSSNATTLGYNICTYIDEYESFEMEGGNSNYWEADMANIRKITGKTGKVSFRIDYRDQNGKRGNEAIQTTKRCKGISCQGANSHQ